MSEPAKPEPQWVPRAVWGPRTVGVVVKKREPVELRTVRVVVTKAGPPVVSEPRERLPTGNRQRERPQAGRDRLMPVARWNGTEYDLVNFTEDGEYVLRDRSGDVTITDGVELNRQTVEVRCERCERWNVHAMPARPHWRWVCADRDCYDEERGGGA